MSAQEVPRAPADPEKLMVGVTRVNNPAESCLQPFSFLRSRISASKDVVKQELGVYLPLVWPAQHLPALPGSPSLWFVASSPGHWATHSQSVRCGLWIWVARPLRLYGLEQRCSRHPSKLRMLSPTKAGFPTMFPPTSCPSRSSSTKSMCSTGCQADKGKTNN